MAEVALGHQAAESALDLFEVCSEIPQNSLKSSFIRDVSSGLVRGDFVLFLYGQYHGYLEFQAGPLRANSGQRILPNSRRSQAAFFGDGLEQESEGHS